MPFETLPPFAAWRHRDARAGFEVVFLRPGPEGHLLEGHTAAVEDGQPWAVRYSIVIDASWATRSAHVIGLSGSGHQEVRLESDGAGAWLVNGASAPQLAGCVDVDLESSSFTNALPVHRLRLAVAQEADAPAAYVRALDLAVERLEQRYLRMDDQSTQERYLYSAPHFDYAGELVYDAHGLLLDYPGIAERVV